MESKLEKEYNSARKNYLNLKIASTNNGYIEYFINQTMQAVESIEDVEERISLILESELPKLSQMSAGKANETFQQYLERTVGKLDYQLSDIKKMLQKRKRNALLGLVIEVMIRPAIKIFMKTIKNIKQAFSAAFKQVSTFDDSLFKEPVDLPDRFSVSQTLKRTQVKNVFKKLKYAPKVIKQLFKNSFKGIRNKFNDLKTNIKGLNSVKSFKEKMKNFFKSKIGKIVQSVKSRFTSTRDKIFKKTYKLRWTQKFYLAIGIIGNGIATGIQVKQWEKVSRDLRKAREDYEKYQSKLKNEIEIVEKELKTMENTWNGVIEVFKAITIPFKEMVENTTKYENFSDVIGLPKLQVDKSYPIFSINFDSVSKESVLSQQNDVIQFMKNSKKNITEIRNELMTKEVMYTNAFNMSKEGKTISDMYDDIKSMLRSGESETRRAIGNALTPSDVVCAVAILRYDLEEYDFFPIDAFRPRCDVNRTTFELWKRKAFDKRKFKLMRKVITEYVSGKKKESVSALLDAVHNAYYGIQNNQIATIGKDITEQDVICSVAEQFIKKFAYDFIKLDLIRPACLTVDSRQIQKLLNEAEKLRAVALTVKSALETCRDSKFCPCLSTIAKTKHATEADIEYALKQIDASWQPNVDALFCGSSGCNCFHV